MSSLETDPTHVRSHRQVETADSEKFKPQGSISNVRWRVMDQNPDQTQGIETFLKSNNWPEVDKEATSSMRDLRHDKNSHVASRQPSHRVTNDKDSKRRRRLLFSCENCKKRKVKCDRTKPCSGCCARGAPQGCSYITDREGEYAPIEQSYRLRKLRAEHLRLIAQTRDQYLQDHDDTASIEYPQNRASAIIPGSHIHDTTTFKSDVWSAADPKDTVAAQADTLFFPSSKTNSGSRGGGGADTRPTRSIDSTGSSRGTSQNFLHDFFAFFGDLLIAKTGAREWMGCTLSQCSKEEVEKRVTVLLRNFALAAVSSPPATSQGVTSRQTQKLFMDAVTLVRRYSPEIAQYFRIQSAPPSMNTTSLATCIEGLVQPMAFGQKSSPFHRVIGNHSEEDEESDDDSDLEDALLGQFHKVQDSLVSCASFLQLALQLRRDLYSHDRAEKEAVNNAVLESLLPASISDTNVSSQLRVKWDIKDFMLRQYGEMVPLRSVVVLIGTVLYAQATTCGEYIQANWPETGPFVLDMIESCVSAVDLLAPTKHAFEDCSPTTSLVIYSGYVEAQMVNASPRITSEVTQVLAWLGAAVRLSPHEENLSYSRPSLRPLPVNSESIRIVDSKLEIDYRCEPLHETEKACWLPLFQGAVITPGFPIPNRAEETGLEISLDLVAGIVGARHAVEYAGGIVLKGFSHMIVPVQRKGNCVQWHTVTNADTQSRLTYNDGLAHCGTRALIGELNFADLHHTRAIVGWCSVATSRLGSDAADYENIDYSDAKVAGSVVRCAGGQIGFQQFGTGAVDFRLGIKEGNLHIPRLGRYVKIVSAAEKTPVLLYDTGNRRAWLVSASDVLLHMAKHRHCLDPFEVDDKQIILETTVADGMSARSVLLRNEKQKLSDDNYIFRDLILDFWSQLERLVDQNMVREQNTQGVAVKASFREYLRGYELKAIVEERSPFVMKEQELLKTNGGWPKLVRDINALVLFADELGEVLLPADERQVRLCSLWRRVPSNCDYLATTSKILVDLYNVSGCRTSRKFLTSTELRWHCGTSCLFEDCKDVRTCRCNRLQQIIPNASLGSVVCPDTIADHGAVIFGHSGSLLNDVFPWSGAATRQESNMYSQLNSPLLFVETSSTSHDETSTSEQSGQSASDGTSDSHLSSLSTCTTQSTHDTTPDLHPTPPRVTQEQTGCSRKRLRFPNRTVKLSNQQKESYKTFETIEPSTIGVKRQRKVSGEDLHEYCQPV